MVEVEVEVGSEPPDRAVHAAPQASLGSSGNLSWEEAVRATLRTGLGDAGLTAQFLPTHRSAHRLARLRSSHGDDLFVKAFAPWQQDAFTLEVAIYRQLHRTGIAPRLVHVDEAARLLVTEAAPCTRLSDLGAPLIRRHLAHVPAIYTALVGLRSLRPSRNHARRLVKHHAMIASSPEAEGLPAPSVVIQIVEGMAEMPVHGDFQPANLLADAATLRVVDFESYGPDVPAVDVARIAYNPLLPLDAYERSDLAAEMLYGLSCQWGVATSSREFAAACVYWAVTCAGYFRKVVAAHGREGALPAEAPVLATRPLALAADLWNRVG